MTFVVLVTMCRRLTGQRTDMMPEAHDDAEDRGGRTTQTHLQRREDRHDWFSGLLPLYQHIVRIDFSLE